MTRILIPSRGPEDWKQFLADPKKQWKMGYSAMAAAYSWEAAKGLPMEIERVLGDGSELLLAIPEHKVALPGKGRESQCDVFCLTRRRGQVSAVAVEAKVEEPFGPTLAEWLSSASSNKSIRFAGLCRLLGCDATPPGHLRYQLFHRTAAAVIEAGRFNTERAAMVVHSFSQERRWFDDFSAFCKFLGIAVKPETGHDYGLPDGRILTLGWATGPSQSV